MTTRIPNDHNAADGPSAALQGAGRDVGAPHTSFVLWYSPRSGSNLLCDLLRFTERAGDPHELFSPIRVLNLLRHYEVDNHSDAQRVLWQTGTAGGVFGMKCQMINPNYGFVVEALKQFPGAETCEDDQAALWNNAFPNCHHIAVTRRNKVRQAVSWYRATASKEWTREPGAPGPVQDVHELYDRDAIHHLLLGAAMTDAMMADFFTEATITPHVVVYEDMVADMQGTLEGVFGFLGLDPAEVTMTEPILERQSDGLSEEWVQQFRSELQDGWQRRW